MSMIFKNREEAGHRLAKVLKQYRHHPDGVILALPRGGAAVGYAMSADLHLPLDVFITRKIGASENSEYALGAISETGNIHLNFEAVDAFQLSDAEFETLANVQREEILRRQRLYRRGQPAQSLKDRVVIVVDDGIATGATFFASVTAIRREQPRVLVAAIPVGPPQVIERARAMVDELVVLETPSQFWSVGGYYSDFRQVSDEEVVNYLHVAQAALHDRTGRSAGIRKQRSSKASPQCI
ncbi:MAG TPA: phosphoribosyltransferase [Nitrospira sp.]|jgi:predicted phosphoribosyltransferase|nr:phosphoribosyltransferase [Nitrospira sp.]